MVHRHFEYVFEDESKDNRITFEYSDRGDEKLQIWKNGGETAISANQAGFMALARICLKMALGSYKPGFDVHLRDDFGGDAGVPDQLCLMILGDH